ncbi:conserved hypothetical protein [Stutzerimonas stutzeri DSM 4166]|nr:conserved hypothetical protein [Stutzerimonas stutzeri DSM 4166]
MVTTAMYPAAKSDFLTVQAFVQLAAIVTAHHGGVRFSYLEFDGAPELGPANGAVTALRKRLYRMRYRLGRQALQHMLMLPGTSAGLYRHNHRGAAVALTGSPSGRSWNPESVDAFQP